VDAEPEGPQEIPLIGGDGAPEGEEEDATPPRLTYMEFLGVAAGDEGTPDMAEIQEFFRRVGQIMGSLAEELANTQAAVAGFMQRIVRMD
jgi:hypothetical protein